MENEVSYPANILKQLPVQWGFSSDHFEEMRRIAEGDMGCPLARIETILEKVVDLYQTGGEQFEPCQVGYHTMRHTLEVTLATCRMLAGWNRQTTQAKITAEPFAAVFAAALFHDIGYLKDRHDHQGKGGKYTFSHVQRSMDIAKTHLQKQWPDRQVQLTTALIAATEFHQPIHFTDLLAATPGKTLVAILMTADILAQVADPCYFDRLPDLFAEFEEGYAFEGKTSLAKRGIRIFGSARELIEESPNFFHQVVLPRLKELKRMDLLLDCYYGTTAHPYRQGLWQNFTYRL